MAQRISRRTSAQQVLDRFRAPKYFVYYRSTATPNPVIKRKPAKSRMRPTDISALSSRKS